MHLTSLQWNLMIPYQFRMGLTIPLQFTMELIMPYQFTMDIEYTLPVCDGAIGGCAVQVELFIYFEDIVGIDVFIYICSNEFNLQFFSISSRRQI